MGLIAEFAHKRGARAVWRSWATNMVEQGREVKAEYTTWRTLPQRDRELDANIAFDVIEAFMEWLNDQP